MFVDFLIHILVVKNGLADWTENQSLVRPLLHQWQNFQAPK